MTRDSGLGIRDSELVDSARRSIERALAQRAGAVHHVELPGRVRGAHAHAARGAAGHPGAVPRHVPSLPADAGLSRRADGAVGTESDQPAGDRRRASACGRPRAPRRAASATRWSRCSRRSRATTPGSRRCAATSRRRARTCRKWSRSSCRAEGRSRASRRSPAGPRATCGRTRRTHDIPLLPLYELGYTSIGCEPCTALPLDPDNPRSGRWQGQKLECGIHIQAK